jgi:Na+-driven multidrug efflux pump
MLFSNLSFSLKLGTIGLAYSDISTNIIMCLISYIIIIQYLKIENFFSLNINFFKNMWAFLKIGF